jgi:hypothetical protein
MSPVRTTRSWVVFWCLVSLLAEIALFSTLGSANTSAIVILRMTYALLVFVPFPLILRGVIFYFIVTPWPARVPALVERVAKWLLFLAPIFLLAAWTYSHFQESGRNEVVGMLIAYLVCEIALGYWFMGISARRSAQ